MIIVSSSNFKKFSNSFKSASLKLLIFFLTNRNQSKIFQGGAQGELLKSMKNELNNIKYFKPDASRRESPETYLVGKKK